MKYKLETPLSPELEKYRYQIEASIKPYIQITVENNTQTTWWQSKFGGFPYLPKDCEYPKTPDGKYLFLLAQINFAEVPPLENFPQPQRGILQFYIADTHLYGWDDYGLGFKILYFPEPHLNVENIITNYIFLPEPERLPVSGCYSLQFEIKSAAIPLNNYQFSKFLDDDFSELLRKNRNLRSEYWDLSNEAGHKIGGYPYILPGTGDARDPDNPKVEQDPELLLLQIDTETSETVNIMWGDGGVGNFFIYESQLKNLDFSQVYYVWDC